MKALVRRRYGPLAVLEVAEVGMPSVGEDEALVKVEAASVNTADLDYMRGKPRVARVGSGLLRPRSPYLGLDVAGRVEAVGPRVTDLGVGDEVWADLFSYGQRAFAEYVVARARAFTPKPESSSFEEAATVPHSGVLALQALLGKGPILPGQEVLINGAGGCVGPFAIQIAKAHGAVVTGVDTAEKAEIMFSAGADHVIDFKQEDVTRSGSRYDLILDIAQSRSVRVWRRALAPRGRFILIARTLGGFFGATAVGGLISLFGTKRMGIFVWRPNRIEDLETLKGLMESGLLRPLIDRRFELGDAPAALRYLAEGRARGKLVIIP